MRPRHVRWLAVLRRTIAALLVAALVTVSTVIVDRVGAAEESVMPAAFAINGFGLRLLEALAAAKPDENTVISPVSVALALAMTYNGSQGETHLAIREALGLGALGDNFNQANQALIETIKDADPSVRMAIANALWAQKGFRLAPAFVKIGRDFYDAPIRSLDFARNPDGAAAVINRWVDHATRGKIPSIIAKLDPGTMLVLTNAVYFKGKWTWPFPKSATAPHDFHTAADATSKVPMMRLGRNFDYLENSDFQAVRLPYGNQRFVMYVLLPKKDSGVPALLSQLNAIRWVQWTRSFGDRQGTLMLPKFTLTYAARLNDALKKLGMGVAFSVDADFSRIHEPPPPLKISDVEHRTFIKVDEKGTEAAAATSVGITATAIMRPAVPPFEMIVDHPFFIAIGEQETGAMLFAGVVTNPPAK
jgi:serine protease inhibitor